MSNDRSAYDRSAWLLLIERIGEALRVRYRAREELPPKLLAMIERLDTKLKAWWRKAPAHEISDRLAAVAVVIASNLTPGGQKPDATSYGTF